MKHQTIISQLTLEEKASLMSGKSVWETKDYPEKGIPSIFLSDGPHGIRKQEGAGDHLGLNASVPVTCFPTAATLANSWDEALLEEVGTALGAEASQLGVHVVLGPGLNIKRNPMCGRNFEYYSEDPYQAGKMAAAMIRGIQSNGVAACPKHFAANSQELKRMSSDSIVDERTFREIYTTGFEIAVKEGKAKSIMTAYNKINGTYANEDGHLLRDILREEWGFDGFVVSDWGGSNDHVLGVQNGSHLEMPSTGTVGQKEIINAVNFGQLDEVILDERVDELLTVVLELSKTSKKSVNTERQHQLSQKAARNSIVLLKNEDRILPLASKTKVALIGEFAFEPRYQGAGSSFINPTQLDKTVDVIKDYDLDVVGTAKGYERTDVDNQALLTEAIDVAKTADVVLLYLGLDEISESEGLDRRHISLPKNQLRLLDEISKVTNKVIAVLSAGSVIDLNWDDRVKGLVHGYLSGQAGARAMLDVLTGKYNPSGKLSETYPLAIIDVPSSADYPAEGDYSIYREGLYVGYRYFETAKSLVKYPYGFGLSYTDFSYNDLIVEENGVRFTLTNTGSVAGSEVAQLYVGIDTSKLYRASKELKGFAKVYLEPGESKEVFIAFDDKTFRYYNTLTSSFEVEAGTYRIMIGTNVSKITLQGQLYKEGTTANLPELDLPSYAEVDILTVSDAEFARLLGRPVPKENWQKGQELRLNDALSQMAYAKSWLARAVASILRMLLNRAEKKGKPDLNLLFLYNMPFRALAKMTGGTINMAMVEGILTIVNGHFFRGLGQTVKAFRQKRQTDKSLVAKKV
ncbi:glycoside hydrolase family 3 C-terminal domain-containing protein [Streptococcus sp. S784/96/1]|uniref:glycoside hydrolase family 3 C-terminal domain-containing protein n=1 Tax=Streptococcus sp. S784/96/1 TaxID=2653499 RepID=UPI00138A166E|nr:glycoside hydrolase family 3 C-terminal domain-containing protein [Streptococcus sp. S784/96/1]